MSRVCDLCGKHAQNGYNVSHANNKTKKLWQPNLQSVRHQYPKMAKLFKYLVTIYKKFFLIKSLG